MESNDGTWAAVGWFHKEYYGFPSSHLYAWAARLDKDGNMLSSTAFGAGPTIGLGVTQAGGSGFFAVGYTSNASAGGNDGYVARLDSGGNAQWQVKIGGKGEDIAHAAFAAPDGGVFVAGRTASMGAGNDDAWLARLDQNGKLLWQQTYGGAANEVFTDVVVVPGGTLVLAGHTWSEGAGGADVLIVGATATGQKQWQRIYGDHEDDAVLAMVRLKSGGFALGGYGTPPKAGAQDFRLLVTDAFGHASCAKSGACFGLTAPDCDDNNPCTLDGCEAEASCAHKAAPDGGVCGTGKVCGAGVCK